MKTEQLWAILMAIVSLTWIVRTTGCEMERIKSNEHVGLKTCQIGSYCPEEDKPK